MLWNGGTIGAEACVLAMDEAIFEQQTRKVAEYLQCRFLGRVFFSRDFAGGHSF